MTETRGVAEAPLLTRALVFNADAWRRAGGDQGDNSQFWERCSIRYTYRKGHERLASVEWPDGHVTCGHIVSMMREVGSA